MARRICVMRLTIGAIVRRPSVPERLRVRESCLRRAVQRIEKVNGFDFVPGAVAAIDPTAV